MQHAVTATALLAVLLTASIGTAPLARAAGSRIALPLVGQGMGQATDPAMPSPTPPTPTPLPSPTPTPRPPTRAEGQQRDLAAEVLRLVNIERVNVGCLALEYQPQLTQAAEGHSQDEAVRDFYYHVSPDGRPIIEVGDRVRAAGYQGVRVNENLVAGYDTAENMVASWRLSGAHRFTMLDCDWRYAGVGVYHQPDDQPNVQSVDFSTGQKVPFGPDGYSVQPQTGVKVRGPYYYYTTLVVGVMPTLAQRGSADAAAIHP